MSIILGKDIIIMETVNGVPTAIAAAKSCKIKTKVETIKTSFPTTTDTSQGAWDNHVAQRRGWSVSLDYLVPSVKDSLMRVGSTYTLTITKRDSTEDKLTGTAICVQSDVVGSVGSIANGSFEFLGTGPLEAVEPPST